MNNSESASISTGLYKKLTSAFLAWAVNWVKGGPDAGDQYVGTRWSVATDYMLSGPRQMPYCVPFFLKAVKSDLPEVVCILQALGFIIRRMDSCNPEIISPLSGGKKGVRVVITCLQSGQRCFLENPQPPEACNCAKDVGDQSIGNFWEVECHSASQGTFVLDTGYCLIPPMSQELRNMMRDVIHYFIRRIRASTYSTVMGSNEGEESFTESFSDVSMIQ